MHAPRTSVLTLALIIAPQSDTTFRPAEVTKGACISVLATSESKFTMVSTRNGKELRFPAETTSRVACTATITELDTKGVASATLLFGECAREGPGEAGQDVMKFACSGRQYEVHRSGPSFKAEKRISVDESGSVSAMCDSVLASPLASVLVGKSLKPGDSIEVPQDTAGRALAMFVSTGAVKTMSLTLVATRKDEKEDVVVFKMAATYLIAGNESTAASMTIVMGGEFIVDKKRVLLKSADLDGTITIGGSEEIGSHKTEYSGTGTGKWKYVMTMK